MIHQVCSDWLIAFVRKENGLIGMCIHSNVGVETIFQKFDSRENREKVKMVKTQVITINPGCSLQS